jgi:hypothetical protein
MMTMLDFCLRDVSISKRSLQTTKRITTTDRLACCVPYYVMRRVVTPRPVSIKRLGVSGPAALARQNESAWTAM